jgi:hypothetical protein
MADKPDDIDESVSMPDSVSLKPPFDPNSLTTEEKIQVMKSIFTYHPGQFVRNLLNENGYIHMIGINLNGTKLYGVMYEKHQFQFETNASLKPIGFQKDPDDKPLSQERKTDIDESIHKGIKKHQKDYCIQTKS